MRILVVSQYFWPENFRINDLVSEWCRRGHEITVLTGYPNYPAGQIFPEFRNNPGDFQMYGAARVVRVPMLTRGHGSLRLILNYLSFVLSASLLGAWRLRGRAFDLVFVFEPSPITVGLPAVLLRQLKGAPLVFWVLDLWPETLAAVGAVRSKRVLKWVGYLVSFIYKRCDLVLAQSKSFIPQIRRYCGANTAVRYFPSWSEAVFDLANVDPAQEVPDARGAFSVMFAGNIGEAQDFPAILDAAELLKEDPNIRWLIVGDGRAAEWVRSETIRRRIENRFLLLGRYAVERMPSFYKHADALLMSLKDEPIFAMTIPGKLQSYLAAGIPVIAMLNGEGADIVEISGAGLSCPAGNGAALAAVVRKLAVMERNERCAMGQRGLAIARNEFDRATLITQLLSWFDELLAGKLEHMRAEQ